MYRVIIFATILALAYATPVSKCKGDKPQPVAVRIKGCNEQPCKVVKGTSGQFEVDFVAPHQITALTTKVLAKALGVEIEYKLPKDVADVCKNLDFGATCPLDEQEDARYKFEFPISKAYPEIKVNLELTMMDQNNGAINCFSVDIQVVKQ